MKTISILIGEFPTRKIHDPRSPQTKYFCHSSHLSQMFLTFNYTVCCKRNTILQINNFRDPKVRSRWALQFVLQMSTSEGENKANYSLFMNEKTKQNKTKTNQTQGRNHTQFHKWVHLKFLKNSILLAESLIQKFGNFMVSSHRNLPPHLVLWPIYISHIYIN